MVRTRTKPPTTSDDKVSWKKKGGGTFRAIINGKYRIIKENETFLAKEEEIPEGFKDLVICLEQEKLEALRAKQSVELEAPEELYQLEEKGGGWWNVINKESGQPMNAHSLREDAARKLLQDLQG